MRGLILKTGHPSEAHMQYYSGRPLPPIADDTVLRVPNTPITSPPSKRTAASLLEIGRKCTELFVLLVSSERQSYKASSQSQKIKKQPNASGEALDEFYKKKNDFLSSADDFALEEETVEKPAKGGNFHVTRVKRRKEEKVREPATSQVKKTSNLVRSSGIVTSSWICSSSLIQFS